MNELARSNFVGPGDGEGHHGQILDFQQLWFGEVFGSSCPERKLQLLKTKDLPVASPSPRPPKEA